MGYGAYVPTQVKPHLQTINRDPIMVPSKPRPANHVGAVEQVNRIGDDAKNTNLETRQHHVETGDSLSGAGASYFDRAADGPDEIDDLTKIYTKPESLVMRINQLSNLNFLTHYDHSRIHKILTRLHSQSHGATQGNLLRIKHVPLPEETKSWSWADL